MSEIVAPYGSPFEAIKQTDEDGDHWTGRTLQPLMEYSRWEDFAIVIEKAKAALALVSGPEQAAYHFREIPEVIPGGRWGSQTVASYRLTKHGAYLTAMAGDDTKEAVAHARVYFAVVAEAAEKTVAIAVTEDQDLDIIDAMVRAQRNQRMELRAQGQRLAVMEAKVEAIEGRFDWFAALAYAKLNSLPSDSNYLKRVGTRAGRLLRAQGLAPEKIQDRHYGTVNSYPVDVLKQAFEEEAEAQRKQRGY